MILDEPTNHLDVDSREALIHALNDYEGAVILISHDRHLIEACADRLWIVRGGTVAPYDGDLESYKALCLSERGKGRAGGANGKAAESADARRNRQDERRSAADRRAELAPLKKKQTELEKRIDELNRRSRRSIRSWPIRPFTSAIRSRRRTPPASAASSPRPWATWRKSG